MGSPSLVVRRVKVDGKLGCDLKFTRGLNIVRAVPTDGAPISTNKCGKTALVELIQHGLGRRAPSKEKFFLQPIAECVKTLWLEAEVNGKVVLVERSLQEIYSTLKMRWEPYHDEIQQTRADIVSVEEFSQVFLDLMSVPEVSVKTHIGDTVKLTLPNLMRAFVLHQEDSFGGILDKMLPEVRRTQVIGFLTKIISPEAFELEPRVATAQREADLQDASVQHVMAFLADQGVATSSKAEERLAEAEMELRQAQRNQSQIEKQLREGIDAPSGQQGGKLDDLRRRLLDAKEEAAKSGRSLAALSDEETRLREVLASLQTDQQKLRRLRASSDVLSSIDFKICPRCLQGLTSEMRLREEYARCSLCNRPLNRTSDAFPRTAPSPEYIESQTQETNQVLLQVEQEIAALRERCDRVTAQVADLEAQVNEATQSYISPAMDALLAHTAEVALKQSNRDVAKALLEQARALEKMRDRLAALRDDQARLEDQLRKASRASSQRLELLRHQYEAVLSAIDFPGFENCEIKRDTLFPYISGRLYIHVGTALKGLATVAYHLALLRLAQATDTFMPKMLVIDSPAHGDLNEDSHDKLLRYLAQLASGAGHSGDEPLDWQIILTTRRMLPQLEPFVVESVSSPGRMLLR